MAEDRGKVQTSVNVLDQNRLALVAAILLRTAAVSILLTVAGAYL